MWGSSFWRSPRKPSSPSKGSDEKIASLDQRIHELQAELKSVGDHLATAQLQQDFITNLSEQSIGKVAKNLASGKTDLDKTESLLNFVGQHHQNLSEQMQQHQEQMRQLQLEIKALEQQKSLLRNPSKTRHYALMVNVEVAGDGDFTLEVTYQVSNARWVPRYDLSINTVQKQLALDYLADVFQSTGEDWNNADLTISTAQVRQGTIPPKLSPWYLNIPSPRRVSKAKPGAVRSAMPMAKSAGAPPPAPESFAMELDDAEEEIIEAAPVSAEVKQQGSTVTFHVGAGGDIPSDGNPHQVNLFHGDYPIELNHFAIPCRVSFRLSPSDLPKSDGWGDPVTRHRQYFPRRYLCRKEHPQKYFSWPRNAAQPRHR